MTDDLTPSRGRLSPRLTPASLAAAYSLGAHRAIIDAADGHAAAPMLRALAHIGGLAHAAAGYPRHLLSPLRDVLAAVDRLPDAAALAAWALGEMPAGDVEPRPDGEVAALRARAEAAEKRAEAAEAELAQARADRALMAGLWLITVPHDVLPTLLPTDQGDRDRLAAALDAVDLQPSGEARIAAGRAVVGRIVAQGGGAA